MKFLFAIITIACAMYDDASGARILMMTPHQAKSHYIVYEALLKRLAERGHQVVSFNHFPQKTVLPNFTDVDISSSMPHVVGTKSIKIAFQQTMLQKLGSISRISLPTCQSVLEHPELKKFLHSKEKFDVYIMEIFLSDCFIGIGHALKIPIVVEISSTMPYPWTNGILRNPENPSYIPNLLSNFSDEMNFFERAANVMYFFISKLAYRYVKVIESFFSSFLLNPKSLVQSSIALTSYAKFPWRNLRSFGKYLYFTNEASAIVT